MVKMAKGSLPFLLFNLRKMLNHRVLVLGVTAALSCLVLWQAGSLVWKLWLLNEEPSQPATLVQLPPENTEPDSLQNLLRYPLIRSASEPTAPGATSIDAPKTSLKLKLVGLMYSTDKDQARAIIESQSEGARSYAIRERVTDNAEIYSIERDRVILTHAGKKEALLLDPENQAASVQAGAADQPADAADTSQAPVQNLAGVPKKTADLMREFSATPVTENGELVGFELKALQNPEIMESWGIRPGDVITAVNGVALNAPGRVMVLYDKLRKQREFEVTLSNAGNTRTITVDLND